MGVEVLEMMGAGLFVAIVAGSAVHSAWGRWKKRASAARLEVEQEQLEQLRAKTWEEQLPEQLDAVRSALERMGLRPEPATRHDNLRSWSHFGLPSDNDLVELDDELAGLTGHGEIDGARVALTLSVSRARTFSGFMRRLGILWRIDLDGRLPPEVELASDRFSWGPRTIWFQEKGRTGDTFRAVFDGFAQAHDRLTAGEDVHTMFEPYTLVEGELWFAYKIGPTMDVDALVAYLERGRVIRETVDWPASWTGYDAACLGMLERAASDSYVFERLLGEVLESSPEAARERARDLLVERAGRGDGHAMNLLGRRAPGRVARLDAGSLPGLLDAARAAFQGDSEGPYDVSWALEQLPHERWLTAEVSLELRADILRGLGVLGVDDALARAQARELVEHPDLSAASTYYLMSEVARADNPVLVPGVVARSGSILSGLAEREEWNEYDTPVARLDYVLRMVELGPERVREIPELEPFLIEVLASASAKGHDDWQLRVVQALGHVGSRRAVVVLHELEERALVGLGGVTRAARDARDSIVGRIGDVAHGGLSVADATDATGGLSVATGESGGLTLGDD